MADKWYRIAGPGDGLIKTQLGDVVGTFECDPSAVITGECIPVFAGASQGFKIIGWTNKTMKFITDSGNAYGCKIDLYLYRKMEAAPIFGALVEGKARRLPGNKHYSERLPLP